MRVSKQYDILVLDMTLKIQDTLTGEKREFTPLEVGKVKFYHCGPTVYWVQQIGNMRAMVWGDLIRRSLEYLGYEVTHVRNYTDVGHLTGDNLGDADTGEDRMEKGAKREGTTPQEIADKYIALFEKDTSSLNIKSPTYKPRATEFIEQIQEMVKTLIEKDFAYVTEKAIYFDISKKGDYNKLNKQNLEENKEGAGSGDVSDPNKRNPQDFAVWFFKTGVHENALQTWSSPWGEGFPGWHIECSAMIKSLLGDTIDLHMGGVEHIPVHHTNEIAQSESANGVPFVNYWLHNEHLLVDNKKMGKSEGNAYVLSDLVEKKFDPLALRYLFLQSHYRSKQNFTWESFGAAANAYKKLKANTAEYKKEGEASSELDAEYKRRFVEALDDDFNVPYALGVLWEVVRSTLSSEKKLALVQDFDKVLGLNLTEQEEDEVPASVLKLAKEREEARLNKDFAKSDELRTKIEEAGYEVKDTAEGPSLRKR